MTTRAQARGKSRKRSSKIEPSQPFEYVLLMTQRSHEVDRLPVTFLALRTVKEFTNFKYELVVDARLDDRTLVLDVRGLRAPELTFPAVGPATFETAFSSLHGVYNIVVKKVRKESAVFHVNVTAREVALVNTPTAGFVEFVTRVEDW